MNQNTMDAVFFNRYIEKGLSPAAIRGMLFGALMKLYDDDTVKVKEHIDRMIELNNRT